MTDQEINEAVAWKLGWKKDPLSTSPWVRPENVNTRWREDNVPDYCHSIEAAWEVVKRFPKAYFLLMKAKGDKLWKCDIGDDETICVVLADTAPQAICKAFLKFK